MDITKMSVAELESLAYRLYKDRDLAQQNLNIVEQTITTRKGQEVAQKEKSAKKTDIAKS